MNDIDERIKLLPAEYSGSSIDFRLGKRRIFLNFASLEDHTITKEIRVYLHDLEKEAKNESTIKYDFTRHIEPFLSFIRINPYTLFSFLSIDSSFINEFKDYLLKNGLPIIKKWKTKTYPSVYLSVVTSIKHFMVDFYDDRTEFDRDIWKLSEIGFSSSRHNPASPVRELTFYELKNENNKVLLKKYLKYLFCVTNKAISTIRTDYYRINEYINYLGNRNIQELEIEDSKTYIEYLSKKEIDKDTINVHVYSLKKFLDHLMINEEISTNIFSSYERQYIYPSVKPSRIVEPEVVRKIFEILDRVDTTLCCMFLTLFCTGMRCSEVCVLERENFYRNDNGCFIRFFQPKMRKEVVNLIPPSLYNWFSSQSNLIEKEYSSNERYLFRTKSSTPFLSHTFIVKMQEVFDQYKITKRNGDRYVFRPHDYRHTLATYLAQNDYPVEIIQKVLHHDSYLMSLTYIDRVSESRRKKYFDFINIKGEQTGMEVGKSEEWMKMKWLRENINAQILPNGICALPVAAGNCPHGGNVCLTCSEFRTDRRYLPIHEKHLVRVYHYIDEARKRNWIRQLQANEELRDNLINIIARIKLLNEVCHE